MRRLNELNSRLDVVVLLGSRCVNHHDARCIAGAVCRDVPQRLLRCNGTELDEKPGRVHIHSDAPQQAGTDDIEVHLRALLPFRFCVSPSILFFSPQRMCTVEDV